MIRKTQGRHWESLHSFVNMEVDRIFNCRTLIVPDRGSVRLYSVNRPFGDVTVYIHQMAVLHRTCSVARQICNYTKILWMIRSPKNPEEIWWLMCRLSQKLHHRHAHSESSARPILVCQRGEAVGGGDLPRLQQESSFWVYSAIIIIMCCLSPLSFKLLSKMHWKRFMYVCSVIERHSHLHCGGEKYPLMIKLKVALVMEHLEVYV